MEGAPFSLLEVVLDRFLFQSGCWVRVFVSFVCVPVTWLTVGAPSVSVEGMRELELPLVHCIWLVDGFRPPIALPDEVGIGLVQMEELFGCPRGLSGWEKGEGRKRRWIRGNSKSTAQETKGPVLQLLEKWGWQSLPRATLTHT